MHSVPQRVEIFGAEVPVQPGLSVFRPVWGGPPHLPRLGHLRNSVGDKRVFKGTSRAPFQPALPRLAKERESGLLENCCGAAFASSQSSHYNCVDSPGVAVRVLLLLQPGLPCSPPVPHSQAGVMEGSRRAQLGLWPAVTALVLDVCLPP